MFNKNNWFWQSVHENRKIYYQIFFASIFINIFAVMSAFYIMTVYDKVLPNSAFSSLIALTIGMVFVMIFDFIMKMLRSYFIDIAGRKLDDSIADKIYSKIVGHNKSVVGEQSSSTVSTIREFEVFRDFFTSSSLVLFIDVPFMIFFLGILWSIAGIVALVPTLIVPLVILVTALVQPNLRSLAQDELTSKTSKLGVLMEILNSHETIRTVAGENFLKKRWTDSIDKQNEISVVSKVFANFSTTFTQSSMQASQTFIVFFGVYLVSSATISTGALIACVILSGRTLSPLVQLGGILTKINSAVAAFKKITLLMESEDQDQNIDENAAMKLDEGRIVLTGVDVVSADRKILNNINININHNEKVGIIGPVGGGKSTFIKAIIGYNEITNGAISISGYDIDNIDSKNLRKNIAYVPQTIHLFSGSIQENIIAGYEDIENEDVISAAKKANAHDFISMLPGGYSFKLTEKGLNLSGGQRQRIALARAFVKKSLIAILDEPTSSLDSETENILLNTLKTEYSDSTLIIATHKTALLSVVDRIILIANGGITLDGPKDEIIKRLSSQANIVNEE